MSQAIHTALPKTMRAIGYTASLPIDNPQALQDLTLPLPSLKPHDLLVKISAIAANPVDYKIRQNRPGRAEKPEILGWDAVGTVVATGDAVTLFQTGDQVFYAGALDRPGANSEFHAVDERLVGLKPNTLSAAEAAALPLTAITAWELLFDRLQLDQPATTPATYRQKVLLISGAAGGVGSIMVQLAKCRSNAIVIGTASRPESQDWVKALGADYVINHQLPLAEELTRIGIKEVSHIASLVDTAAYYDQFIAALAPQGKLALIDDPKTALDIRPLKLKSLSLHWELMFTRSLFQTPDQQQQHQLLTEVAKLVDSGQLKSTVGQQLGAINAANLRRAHALLEQGQVMGKLVLAGFTGATPQ
ncbi:zinc-binding alcohol dehydrogenase family protein [Rheinheimera muenzenbergensis]|uniref:Zinc-type alcohol dehydrogenase-like protein n=1 Tax=Rheinheimera muenzenbergensis TaxID=1193628 RepID=A0ABU8CDQ4_9GAMM